MKKLLFLIPFFILSCSKSDKMISSLKSEIGDPKNVTKVDEKRTSYQWEKISIGKCDVLKNSIDKSIGIIPTKSSGIQSDIVDGKSQLSEYYIWEVTLLSTTSGSQIHS